jgi:hypothetical protein
MAIAVAPPAGARKVPVVAASGIKMVLADVTLTGAYATGGEALDPKAFGLKRIVAVTGSVTEAAGQTTAWMPHWDNANAKLKLFGAAVGATGATEHAAAAYAAVTVGHLIVLGVPT